MLRLRQFRNLLLGLVWLSFAYTMVLPWVWAGRAAPFHRIVGLDQLNPVLAPGISNFFLIPGKELKGAKTTLLAFGHELLPVIFHNQVKTLQKPSAVYISSTCTGILHHVPTYLKVCLLRI